ncbi:MAG TPA: hypothetical protein VL727_26220 [Puia sp.]|jgi:hypothetical protein|nr:hypothetical protein [Puia sp.]
MTSKPVLLSIVVSVLLFSCQQSEDIDNNTPTEILVNTSVFPVQPLQLDSPANLRLSFTGRTATDSSVFYQVMATYKGETVGFNLSVPKGEEGTAYFSGTGKVSDNFLRCMQEIYGRPADTSIHFAEDVSAHFVALGALLSNGSAHSHDSTVRLRNDVAHVHDSTAHVSDSAARPLENLGTENKLIFRIGATGDSGELYLEINEKDHWIGLAEKDTLYRDRLIRALTRQL